MPFDKIVYEREAQDWEEMADREEEMIREGCVPDTGFNRTRVTMWRNNAKFCQAIIASLEFGE